MKLSLDAKELPPGSGRGNLSRRLIIGAIAVVVIGAVAYFLSQPKKGTVEWYKKEYLRAYELTYHTTLKDRAVSFCHRLIGLAPVRPPPDSSFAKGLSTNWLALRKKGFVRVEVVYLTSRESREVVRALPRQLAGVPIDHKKLTGITAGNWAGQQIIIVGAPASDVPRWKELIRQADVPESK